MEKNMMMHGLASFLIAAAAALSPNSAIVVGGSSGMGKAAAAQFVEAGGCVLLVSRDADKLDRAREEILHATGADGAAVDTAAVDAADEASVAAFAAGLASGAYDALVVSAAIFPSSLSSDATLAYSALILSPSRSSRMTILSLGARPG